jgi:hypothetical protein
MNFFRTGTIKSRSNEYLAVVFLQAVDQSVRRKVAARMMCITAIAKFSRDVDVSECTLSSGRHADCLMQLFTEQIFC